jgi:branched-chain amino acid transport system permease protein
MPAPDIFGWTPVTRVDWYVVVAVPCLASLFVADSLLRTRTGRAWAVIRQKEPVATALGIPVVRYKVLAFVVSSMILGLQGAVYAYFIGNITVELWDLNSAISYVAMIVLGGLGSVAGSVIGAAIITLLPFLLANYLSTTPGIPQVFATHPGFITTFLYGAVISVMLLIAPRGVSGFVADGIATARHMLRRFRASGNRV